MVPCSLGVPLTQEGEYLVPETPESSQLTLSSASKKREREEQIRNVTAFLESKGYTSFTHKTKFGGTTRIMHLAFHMEYEEEDDT